MTMLVMLDPMSCERLDRIRPFLPDGWDISTASSRADRDQLDALKGATFAITADVPVTAEMMATPGLRAVHKWGVGYDNIDCDAARAHGIRVMRTTGSNAVTVAETTLGLILAFNRNIVRGHVGVMKGEWPKHELASSSSRLSGSTVGIIGLGHIGKALARLLAGFGCTILYNKRTPLPAQEEAELGVRAAALDELLAVSDVVSLHCALNEESANLINRDRLSRMKPGALLVNVARGGVVVEADLAEAVRSGHLRGAAVDVFAIEPIEAGNPLLGLDRLILTPHIGAISADGFAPSVERMIANMRAVEEGREPPERDVLV